MEDVTGCVIPLALFLDEFYPTSSDNRSLPKLHFCTPLPCEQDGKSGRTYGYTRGDSIVTDVCRAINDSKVCPSIRFIDTESVRVDLCGVLAAETPSVKLKVAASGMLRPKAGEDRLELKPNWGRMKVAIEFRLESEDPIMETCLDWMTEQREKHSPNAIHASGQTSSYALHQFNARSHTHVTSISIAGRWARLLRYDHSGVVVSERFDWRSDDGRLLAEFLSRLEHATAQQDGVDDSVCDASNVFTKPQLSAAVKAMQEFSAGMIDVPIKDDAPLRAVMRWDDSKLGDNGLPSARTLIATEPLGVNVSIVGRFTVSFIGYNPVNETAYWVKDSWPIDRPGEFEKEGQIYEQLAKAGVPHLAGVECAGEVRWKEDGTVQKSRTADFVGSPWAGSTVNIHPLSHYRILFKDIGRPITRFESTKQLVRALSHAIEAHSVAYQKANVLHRDISAGNILINRKGDGMLIDWDLALVYNNAAKLIDDQEPRLSWRTGTWAFLSCALLEQPSDKVHEISDDLESFFWVLLFVVLRYRYGPFEWASPGYDKTFQEYLLRLFEWRQDSGEFITGGQQKRTFLLVGQFGEGLGHISQTALLDMLDLGGEYMPDPLGVLLFKLRDDFKNLYAPSRPSRHADDSRALLRQKKARRAVACRTMVFSAAGTVFANATHLQNRFTEALEKDGWRNDDAAIDRFPRVSSSLKTLSKLEKVPAVCRVRSDDPTFRRLHDPTNNLHYEVAREDAAADVKRRLGEDFVIPKPKLGVKRALSTIDESDEGEAADSDEECVALVLERREVTPPPKRQRMDKDGRPRKDVNGKRVFLEAWSD
ncbi:unnamed protein product [Peniophora sp. CBMAI 1063]|nr:unnamed protein product [Peniophora sp. CBMAI 1063]